MAAERRLSPVPATTELPAHRLARPNCLGIRQAHYFGGAKTKFQVYLAANVANLTLLANQIDELGDPDPGPTGNATTTQLAIIAAWTSTCCQPERCFGSRRCC